MPSNYLEQLVAEWYQFSGYFVRQNIPVGRRPRGGYESELDVVAFHPQTKHLVHVEPSMDADSWEKRERRYRKKFDLGREHIPRLFEGIPNVPKHPEQIALLCFASRKNREALGGGRVMLIDEFLGMVLRQLKTKRIASKAVSEQFPILRTLQFVAEYKGAVRAALFEKATTVKGGSDGKSPSRE